MNEDEIKDIVLNKIKEYYDKGRDELAEFRKNKMVLVDQRIKKCDWTKAINQLMLL